MAIYDSPTMYEGVSRAKLNFYLVVEKEVEKRKPKLGCGDTTIGVSNDKYLRC